MLVVVDVKTLLLDNQASASQREPFIRLYSTVRSFDADLEEPFTLQLEYRNANVIDFGNKIDLGDLQLSKADIDDGDAIVLPRTRDIRITMYPVCSDKPGKLGYFGFAKTRIDEELYRIGEPFEFFVREDADDEEDFFSPGLESHQLQGLYLQPDPPQVNNPLTIVASVVAGSELPQTHADGADRVAAPPGLQGPNAHRQARGAHAVRLQQPDPAHAGARQFVAHVRDGRRASRPLAVRAVIRGSARLDVGRPGRRRVSRFAATRQFTGEAATVERRGRGPRAVPEEASRVATTGPDRELHARRLRGRRGAEEGRAEARDRRQPVSEHDRRVLHAHADDSGTSVTPAAAPREAQTRDVQLPVTTVPTQVPKIVGAGYALSPYQRNHEYSETAVRQRYLWLEFEEPIRDPNDTYFARVLAYAPDPLLTFPNPDQMLVRQDDPPLAIDPELIRVITHGQGNDNAGIDAMQPMIEETADPSTPLVKVTPVHYLLPLPPGLHSGVARAVRLLHLRAACRAHEPDLVHGARPLRPSRRG